VIPVFYNPKQSVTTVSFSPSSSKPAPFVARCRLLRLRAAVIDFKPATREDLYSAHQREMVDDILDLKRQNGFGNTDKAVAESLPYTSGSLLAAARYVSDAALAGEAVAACSPTSGFHHAGHSWCHGYCTFNGLMVAAIDLLKSHERVGIIDCDYHYGDGTQDIIEHLGLERRVLHFTAGASFKTRHHALKFLERLPAVVEEMSQAGVKVVLYQAGADQHARDPLGGFLSQTEMAARDALIFDSLRSRNMGVVWNLAGGYQDPIAKVLKLHVNTMKECIDAYL
jgi:acetoin utilization deacetylase AcuC-like enzyme